MGNNPDEADKRWLREAMENRVPVIYFLGVAPGCYQAFLPTFIVGWDRSALKARVDLGMAEQSETQLFDSVAERRYALREVKQRRHQASFREAAISAGPS